MKANEAPKKIYVKITHPISDEYTEMIAFKYDDGIEYVRADAIIEKAAEYLSEIENGTTITDIDKFVEDFKKAMKL